MVLYLMPNFYLYIFVFLSLSFVYKFYSLVVSQRTNKNFSFHILLRGNCSCIREVFRLLAQVVVSGFVFVKYLWITVGHLVVSD